MIAEPNGVFSAGVHAPTSGKVSALEERQVAHPSGMATTCIVIQCDGEDRAAEAPSIGNYRERERSEIREIIRSFGIIGLGGAGFPTAIKLNPPPAKIISTLIINGTECEPYITADDILMQERANEVVSGTEILAWLLDVDEVLIGIEDNKPEAIESMQKASAGSDIEIISFPTKYPSGGEKQLIQILTGREVPSGGLPADLGIVCQNVGTVAAIYRAIEFGEPLISRITTLTGEALSTPGNVETLIGTPVSFLLKEAGLNEANTQRVIMGGPMMGFTLPSLDVPVVKTTNCLLAATADELPNPPPAQACIRCGLCAEACPAQLLPQQLYWYAQGQDYDRLRTHNLFDCIECGACSYVCPSQIPLVQYYRASKSTIRQLDAEHAQAERARERFEAHQARIEKQQQEKEERRKQRAAKAASAKKKAPGEPDADARQAMIDAAVERVKSKKKASSGNGTADAAAAAIERAQAKRAGDGEAVDPTAKLQKTLSSSRQKLANTEKKLAEARDKDDEKTVALLEQTLPKLQQRIEAVEAQLAAESAQSEQD